MRDIQIFNFESNDEDLTSVKLNSECKEISSNASMLIDTITKTQIGATA